MQPATPATWLSVVDPPIDPGSDVLGLARPAAALRRGRSRRALGTGDEWVVRADACGHRYSLWLDGARAGAGAGADVARRRARRDTPAAAVSFARLRRRQRQRLHERDSAGLLCGREDRVDALSPLSQERSSAR